MTLPGNLRGFAGDGEIRAPAGGLPLTGHAEDQRSTPLPRDWRGTGVPEGAGSFVLFQPWRATPA